MEKPKSARFIHPIHARGVRSPRFDIRGGKLLTDAKIHEYAKAGYYGSVVQSHAIAADKKKKKKNHLKLSVASAMKALGF